jgi:hypothetical protein
MLATISHAMVHVYLVIVHMSKVLIELTAPSLLGHVTDF